MNKDDFEIRRFFWRCALNTARMYANTKIASDPFQRRIDLLLETISRSIGAPATESIAILIRECGNKDFYISSKDNNKQHNLNPGIFLMVTRNPNSHNYKTGEVYLCCSSGRGISKDGWVGNNLPNIYGSENYSYPEMDKIKEFCHIFHGYTKVKKNEIIANSLKFLMGSEQAKKLIIK